MALAFLDTGFKLWILPERRDLGPKVCHAIGPTPFLHTLGLRVQATEVNILYLK